MREPEPTSVLAQPHAAVAFPEAALVDALQPLAGARGAVDIAEAVTAALAGLPGVRAAAVLRKDGRDAVVVGSSGYDCGTMGYGARLPLDSGLPAPEAVRRGVLVRQGPGPGWCAVPFGRRTVAPGAVLLSCDAAPPAGEADLARLQRLADAVGAALDRAAAAEQVEAELATVVRALLPGRPVSGGSGSPARGGAAVRQVPRGGVVGGDVAVAAVVGGARWYVVADVCGSGLEVAAAAAGVRAAVRAAVPHAASPADLLALLDRALQPDARPGVFVTAVAACVRDGSLTVASAGHPAPLLVHAGGVREVAVDPGPPLVLELDGSAGLVDAVGAVPVGALLVLYTDGLTDHRGPDGADLDAVSLAEAAGVGAASPEQAATLLLAAADAAGPAVDDTTVLVAPL